MQMTLEQAVEKLDAGDYPYSQANAKKIRGSANKCRKLPAYNCPLAMIPIDVDAFVKRWSSHIANKDAPEGFDTFKQFETWHGNVKSLMAHASGLRAEEKRLRGLEDDWSQLQKAATALIQPRRKGNNIQTPELIALTVLTSLARSKGVQPAQLNIDMLHLWMKDCHDQGRKNAIRKAARLRDRLHEFPETVGPSLLPSVIGEIPKATRHRVTPDLPAEVISAIRQYQATMRLGRFYDGLLAGRRRAPLSPQTVKSAGEDLNWYFTCLCELGRLDLSGGQSIAKLTTADNLFAAFDAEVGGEYYWKPLGARTLKKNMGTAFRFAREFHPELSKVQKEFFETEYFKNWDTMTEANQAFCRRLVTSPRRVEKFLSLAGEFHIQAVPLIQNYKDLSMGDQARAVRLSLAAAMAAVLTFMPLRVDTLVNLSVTGEKANVSFPIGSRTVSFAIPKEMMKNKKPLTALIKKRGKVDPRCILEWWLNKARPLFMKRLHNPDPRLLLGGARYSNAADAWRYATASADAYMKLHQVRHAIASILINQPGADLNVVSALLNNSPATVSKTYAFFDQTAAIQRGQDGLDAVNNALAKGKNR
ncbi:hypothetical protein [Ruegeria atlantica]|uniref:hypothetical protein n=1 Tax=Ruegeria atlantica TaxID=81569 RepID=UPI0024943AC0|nr:hypothetical protein [Ruegeria atlantica]